MRNLKKVLSLTLALVMMLGMMTFAGAAETKIAFDDFKDKADITKVDAVRLMVDLGILVGDANGYFSPKGEIDRASMAKLVYTAKMGTADAAALAGAGVFNDVAANHWASGFVNYCASTKIIAGTTAVTFAPSAKVTTAAAAKMLLVALGYDAAHQGYVGNSWAVSAMRDANKLGMLDGIDQTANQNLTRENAAQMLYNALNTLTVFNKLGYKFDGTSYVTETVTNKTTLGYEAYHMVKLEATVDKIEAGKATLTLVPGQGAGIKNYTGVLPATADMAGNKVTFFMVGKVDANGVITETTKMISTALMATPFTLLGTSTDGTILFDKDFDINSADHKVGLANKNSKNKTFIAELQDKDKDNYDVKIFVNGETENPATETKSGFVAGTKATKAIEKSGTIVELLDADKNGKADIIRITEKEVTKLPKIETKVEDKKDMVRIGALTGNKFVEASTVTGYADMKKDDIVLVYSVGGVLNIEKAASVEGKIASKKGSEVTIAGTAYAKTGLKGLGQGALPASDLDLSFSKVDYKNTYVFYLDNNKNIVTATKLTEETTSKIAVVLEFGKTGSDADIGGSFTYRVKLMLEDGTTIIPNTTKWDGLDIATKAEAGKSVAYDDAFKKAAANTFVTYTVDKNGNYELTPAKNADGQTVLTIKDDADINGNKAVFATDKATGNAGIVGNSKTIFLVKSGAAGKEVYKAYTGIANLPSVAHADLTGGFALVKDGVATHAYINTAKTKAEVSDKTIAYVAKVDAISEAPNAEDAGVTDYVLDVIIKGEKTTVRMNETVKKDFATSVTTPGLIAFDTVGGIITNKVTPVTMSKGIVTAAGNVLVLGATNDADAAGASNTYTYDKDTVVYVINTDGTVTTVSGSDIAVDATDMVAVYRVSGTAGKTDLAETIYIAKVDSAVATATFTTKAGVVDAAKITTSGDSPTFAGTHTITAAATTALKLNVTAAAGATYTVTGMPTEMPAESGSATVVVKVTSEDNAVTTTYTINLTLTVG